MKIEYIRLKNFKAFKDVEMKYIPDFCVLVGANGTGKTTLFEVFKFLRDAVKTDINDALDNLGGSRGFKEVRSRNSKGAIEITLKYRAKFEEPSPENPLITYTIKINEEKGQAYIEKEFLEYPHLSRKGKSGRYWRYIDFKNGKGKMTKNEEEQEREEYDYKKGPVLVLNKLREDPIRAEKIQPLIEFIRNFHVWDIHIDKTRSDSSTTSKSLSSTGDNLSGVIEYLHKKHGTDLKKVTRILEDCIPRLNKISAKRMKDGRIILEFKEKSFQDPFLARFVSDGTIKLLAYLVLLYASDHYPLVCLEEPENQLYPKILQELAERLHEYTQSNEGRQVFVTTHSPEFLNAVKIEEVFYLEKKRGYTTIKKLSEIERVKKIVNDGGELGYLWNTGVFGKLPVKKSIRRVR